MVTKRVDGVPTNRELVSVRLVTPVVTVDTCTDGMVGVRLGGKGKMDPGIGLELSSFRAFFFRSYRAR